MASNIKKIILILVAVSAVVACSKKSEHTVTGRSGVNALGVGANTPACPTTQQAVGRVYDDNSSGSNSSFEQRVKGLIAATADPQYFGTISGNPNDPNGGVTIEGRLRYDGNGTILLDQTNLRLMIYDSFVGQTDDSGAQIQPYPVNFAAATSGTVNLATKQFTILFRDNYGEVTVSGSINNSTVVGSISYQNYKNFNGVQGSSAVLGAFTIATCAWIN